MEHQAYPNQEKPEDKLTSSEVAEVARRARNEGLFEPLVQAVERVAERMKRREDGQQ